MPDVIRIAHVALQLETGGLERLLAEFARHADRRRFSLHFVTLGPRGRIAVDIESCGWPVTALEAPPGVRPSVVYRLARLFRDERIDLVHTHNTKPLLYAGPAARLARVRGGIHTCHGERRGATRRHNILFRLAARCTDRVICVSENSTRLCHREGIDPRLIQTIWNGIDRERFGFTGPVADGPAVFVGRLSPEKDVATLLKAVAIVVGRLPSFRLQLAGQGPCAAELAQLAGALGIGEHVRFVGEVADVPGLLRRASLFVLPSLTEGLPVAVLEAMACGLPVVATRVGGTPEAVVDGRSGLLVPPGDPEQLADALIRVGRDVGSALRMGLAGRRRIEEYFDVRTMVSRYESVYRDIAGRDMGLAA